MSSDCIVVQTTFDNAAKADEKAAGLREEFQATNIKMIGVKSIFWWEGKIDKVDEKVLTAQISAGRFDEADAYISNEHGYDLPCVIAFDAVQQEEGAPKEWPTDYVLGQTMFMDRATAEAGANYLVECCLVACAKYWPATLDIFGSTNAAPYCFSIETTRDKLVEIEALTLPGKISPIVVKPIVAGKEKFLDWIRDCVAEPKNKLMQILADTSGTTQQPLLENRL